MIIIIIVIVKMIVRNFPIVRKLNVHKVLYVQFTSCVYGVIYFKLYQFLVTPVNVAFLAFHIKCLYIQTVV